MHYHVVLFGSAHTNPTGLWLFKIRVNNSFLKFRVILCCVQKGNCEGSSTLLWLTWSENTMWSIKRSLAELNHTDISGAGVQLIVDKSCKECKILTVILLRTAGFHYCNLLRFVSPEFVSTSWGQFIHTHSVWIVNEPASGADLIYIMQICPNPVFCVKSICCKMHLVEFTVRCIHTLSMLTSPPASWWQNCYAPLPTVLPLVSIVTFAWANHKMTALWEWSSPNRSHRLCLSVETCRRQTQTFCSLTTASWTSTTSLVCFWRYLTSVAKEIWRRSEKGFYSNDFYWSKSKPLCTF